VRDHERRNNLDGRGCPGCGWYIEQLVIDRDGWPRESPVRLAKISKLETLSRPPWQLAVSEVPRRPDAYLGVRFRSVTDAEETTEAEMPSDQGERRDCP
jgi:hypothetical protein